MFPVLDACVAAPTAPVALVASCGTVVVHAPILTSRADARPQQHAPPLPPKPPFPLGAGAGEARTARGGGGTTGAGSSGGGSSSSGSGSSGGKGSGGGGGSDPPPATTAAVTTTTATTTTKSLAWLDDEDAAQREAFVAVLEARGLPTPANETEFHAARMYMDSEKRSV
jgi:hypothetical protein